MNTRGVIWVMEDGQHMEPLSLGREARRPALSSFGQRDLERYVCSKSKIRKGKTTHFHQLSGGEHCHPTQWELGSRLWTEVSLVQARKHIQMLLRSFLEPHLARWERCWAWQLDQGPVRGRGGSSWVLGEQMREITLLCSQRSIAHRCRSQKSTVGKPGWGLAELPVWRGDQWSQHLSLGIFW